MQSFAAGTISGCIHFKKSKKKQPEAAAACLRNGGEWGSGVHTRAVASNRETGDGKPELPAHVMSQGHRVKAGSKWILTLRVTGSQGHDLYIGRDPVNLDLTHG